MKRYQATLAVSAKQLALPIPLILLGAIALPIPLILLGAIALLGISKLLFPQVIPSSPQSQTLQLVPNSIHDGDTLRLTDGRQETKVRLCGIDAPEKDQPMGIPSWDHLRSLIAKGDGTLIMVPVEQDRYGRTVAELFVKPRSGTGYQPNEEISLNAQMVRDGMAYHYARYSPTCPNGSLLASIETEAKTQRLGVWQTPNATKPWDYRKSKK